MFVDFLNKMELRAPNRTLFVDFSNVSLNRPSALQKMKEIERGGGATKRQLYEVTVVQIDTCTK